MTNIGTPSAKSVLRCDATDGNVQRVIGEKEIRASGYGLEREGATLLEADRFSAEVGVRATLLSQHRRAEKQKCDQLNT